MKKLFMLMLGIFSFALCKAQYLTNLNCTINFGDLAEIDVPYKA